MGNLGKIRRDFLLFMKEKDEIMKSLRLKSESVQPKYHCTAPFPNEIEFFIQILINQV